ncbi:hypothetical protein ACFL0H_03580 [Thermodesulfobacteriota bacterium]
MPIGEEHEKVGKERYEDIRKYGLGNIELAKELMSIHPDIPAILCTGFSKQIDEDTAREVGLAAFVMKPIAMSKTASAFRQVLDKEL